MPSELSGTLRDKRSAILAAWAQSGPRSCGLTAEGGGGMLSRGFDSLLPLLHEGDRNEAEQFIDQVSRRAVEAGIPVGDAVRVLLGFKPACLSALPAGEWKPGRLLAAHEALDEVVGWAAARFGERYAERVKGLMDGQLRRIQESEARSRTQAERLEAGRLDLERRVREVEALYRSAEALNSSLEIDRVLQAIVDRAAELMQTGLSAIYEWDPGTNRMRGRIASSTGRDLMSKVTIGLSMAPDLVARIVGEHEPIIVEDMGQHSGPLPAGVAMAAREHGVRAALAAPLIARNRLYGYLATYYTSPRRFLHHEVALLSAFAELAATALENARLYSDARRLASAEERNRIAREIHDTLAQGMSGLVLQLQGIDRYLNSNPELAREELSEAIRLARHNLQEARRSVWELRAGLPEQMALEEAVRAETDKLRADGRVAVFDVEGSPVRLGAEAEHNLYRIVQEALTNVRRHSRARQVRVVLRYVPGVVELVVEDDGAGFPATTQQRPDGDHFGLMGMRERARLMGGSFAVETAPGQGTRIMVRLPVPSIGGAQ
jgi:signal transduction histidine kinase